MSRHRSSQKSRCQSKNSRRSRRTNLENPVLSERQSRVLRISGGARERSDQLTDCVIPSWDFVVGLPVEAKQFEQKTLPAHSSTRQGENSPMRAGHGSAKHQRLDSPKRNDETGSKREADAGLIWIGWKRNLQTKQMNVRHIPTTTPGLHNLT